MPAFSPAGAFPAKRLNGKKHAPARTVRARAHNGLVRFGLLRSPLSPERRERAACRVPDSSACRRLPAERGLPFTALPGTPVTCSSRRAIDAEHSFLSFSLCLSLCLMRVPLRHKRKSRRKDSRKPGQRLKSSSLAISERNWHAFIAQYSPVRDLMHDHRSAIRALFKRLAR